MEGKLTQYINSEKVSGPSATIGSLREETEKLINSFTNEELEVLLKMAIDVECYETAQKCKNEIDERKS